MMRALAIVLLCSALAGAATVMPSARFTSVDIVVDSDRPLAAWQVELVAKDGDARIVGVEGGEAPFDVPAHYDPAALAGGRIILAAFDLRGALPGGRHRLATVHLREDGPTHYTVRLAAAADSAGDRVAATVTTEPR